MIAFRLEGLAGAKGTFSGTRSNARKLDFRLTIDILSLGSSVVFFNLL